MGVFDKLHREIGDNDDARGISPLDLADLPPMTRKLMRMLLREVEMRYDEIQEAVAAWPEEAQPTQKELDEMLAELTRDQWLLKLGQENIRYEANLRRKPPSQLARSIWANLDSKIEAARKAREQAENEKENGE